MKEGRQIKLLWSTEQKGLEHKMEENVSCYNDNTFNYIYSTKNKLLERE